MSELDKEGFLCAEGSVWSALIRKHEGLQSSPGRAPRSQKAEDEMLVPQTSKFLQKAKTLGMLFTKNWAHFHGRPCLFWMCSSLNTTRAAAGKARHLQSKRGGCLHTAGSTAAPGMCQSQEPAHSAAWRTWEHLTSSAGTQPGDDSQDLTRASTSKRKRKQHFLKNATY